MWKVEWAHPEFGQVIASCSADRCVNIWEEPPAQQQQQQQQQDGQPSNAVARSKSSRSWIKLASIVDATDSVVDIKFAPRHVGLKLAVCSLDGHVRIYEAADIMNLSHWQPEQDFEVLANSSNLATGSTIRPASVDDSTDSANRGVTSSSLSRQSNGATCISWSPARFEEPMLVVGCQDGSLRIWQYSERQRKWNTLIALEGQHSGAVHDVSWAPLMGRSYHLIASAGKDGKIVIWHMRKESSSLKSGSGKESRGLAGSSTTGSAIDFRNGTPWTSGVSSSAVSISSASAAESNLFSSTTGTGVSSNVSYEIRVLDVIVPHSNTEVWRVEWNISGTVLATSGDDGTVKLYKRRMADDSGDKDSNMTSSSRKKFDGSVFKMFKVIRNEHQRKSVP